MVAFFITGTDTGVGKTFFTCWLLQAWLARGYQAAALKPVTTGDRADAEKLFAAGDKTLTLDEINPHHFSLPASPRVAAEAEKKTLNFKALNQDIFRHQTRFSHLAVEGVGGWRVPLAPGYEVRNWAGELRFPLIVVARAGLGTLNHTLLTLENIEARGLTCAGVILNPGPVTDSSTDTLAETNRKLLREMLAVPVWLWDASAQASLTLPSWLSGEEA